MPTLAELGRELERKRAELHLIFEKAKTEEIDPVTGQPLFNLDVAQIQEVNQRNEELAALSDSFEKARLAETQAKNQQALLKLKEIDRGIVPPNFQKLRGAPQSKLSDLFLESNEYKGRSATRNRFGLELPDVDLKTLMQESAGYAPANPRTDRVVLSAQRRPVISDVIPTDTTTLTVIKWMEETNFGASADTVNEAGLKPESALAFTERESNVRKIATWLPITEEQLDDVPGLRNLIDNRLTLMLLMVEEDQILNGGGVAPDLDGFLHYSGVQTQAKSTDSIPDAIYKAFTKVRFTGYAEPSAVIIHPNDWQACRLLTTTDGIYIFGNPNEEVEPRIWGKPCVVTTAITENTALTGDFVLYSHISRKMGVRIDVADQHDTYFIYNKLAIRAEMRESLEIFRAAAFCKVTGI